MKALMILSGCAVAAVLLAGCSPKLARTPLGEKEQDWQAQITRSYPGWKAPQTSAAAVADNMSPDYVAAEEAPVYTTDAANEQEATSEDFAAVLREISARNTAEESTEAVAAEDSGSATASTYELYEVKAGDTLSGIAKKFYKDGRKYNRIYEANKDVLKSPNALRPGIKLKIPAL